MRRQITESMPSPQNLQDTDHELQMRLRNTVKPSMSERVTIMRVGAATYGVGGVKERGMEVEREGGGQYQALPKGMFPTTVKVNVDREASLDV